MSIGVVATPAHAAPALTMSSHIYIRPVPGPLTDGRPDQQVIDIDGLVAMSQAAAQDSINHGYTIALRYWGDDPSSDDLLAGPIHPANVFAGSDGLHFRHNVTLPHFLLNEDDENGPLGPVEGSSDFGQDEIYVGSRFLDPSGKTVSLVESNRIEDRL
jgi:hypothetical protein